MMDIDDRLRYGRDRPIRTFVIRASPIIGTAVLVLVASMLPWFRTRFAVDDGSATNTASAWAASTWWSVAVVLCLVAAALGVAVVARQRWALRPVVRRSPAGIAAAAVIVTAVTWMAIPSLDSGRHAFGWSTADPSAHNVGDIIRDQLVLAHRNGLTQQVAWGLYVGLASMTLLTVALLVDTIRFRAR